jgi:3-oxoacyl-[acyl-carrier-protein] synthase III
MALQIVKNVEITGFAACVPSYNEENESLEIFHKREEYQRFVDYTGVERRRKVEKGICASDLCLASAEKLVSELGWEKEDIECLIFVSHSPDYKFPATACIIQSRLGLSTECMSFDISLGCSGWVYGITTIASLVSTGRYKKALLLAGDTTGNFSKHDKSTYPLFGDAGTATALQYHEGAADIFSHMATDGNFFEAIIIEDGGHRNPFSNESLAYKTDENGNVSNRLSIKMDGMTVFSFGITTVPKSVNRFIEYYNLEKKDIDYFVFHQANLMINSKIQKKLGIPDDKMPSVLKNFGNVSAGSIPLTIVSEMKEAINKSSNKEMNILACGFGVGLSWGTIHFKLNNALCCELQEI